MFLHLGGDTVALKKDIIAILDYTKGFSSINKGFMEIAGDEGFIENISESGKEKSYIITSDRIYISPISCSTLKKRSMITFLPEE
ncbi:MAG: extracellular matrix regulator RemB [Desulfocucumaceae bacterium]